MQTEQTPQLNRILWSFISLAAMAIIAYVTLAYFRRQPVMRVVGLLIFLALVYVTFWHFRNRVIWSLTAVGALIVGGYAAFVFFRFQQFRPRIERIGAYMEDPSPYEHLTLAGGERCGDAPFIIPSSGYLGVGWNDGAWPLYQHTGLDIFSAEGENITPIYAVYDGYLTREESWRSAVVIRHPDFEELPEITKGREFWTYYTHMASVDGETSFIAEAFPPGTREVFVEQGTIIGYQGSWSGSVERTDMSRHLHISLPLTDSDGSFMNETEIRNTLNPIPFFGLELNDEGVYVCLE